MAKTVSPKWQIRPAKKEDASSVVWLAQILSEYLDDPRSMTMGEKEMLEYGFGESPWFHVLVAEWMSDDGPTLNSIPVDPEKPSTSTPHNDGIVAHALYFYTYSTWGGKCLCLDNLCVREEYRNSGIGTALMKRCAKLAHEEGCTNMTWTVMDNSTEIEFYEKMGGNIKKDWLTMRLTEPGLGELASEES